MYGQNYDCIICGKHIKLKPGENFSDDNHFIAYTCSSLLKYYFSLYKAMLKFICKRYRNEDNIDIVNIFKKN